MWKVSNKDDSPHGHPEPQEMLRLNTLELRARARTQHTRPPDPKTPHKRRNTPVFEILEELMHINETQNQEQSKNIPTAFRPAETERISWRWRQYKWLFEDGFLLLLDIFFRLGFFFLSNPYIVRNHICMLAFDSRGKTDHNRDKSYENTRQEGSRPPWAAQGEFQNPDLGKILKQKFTISLFLSTQENKTRIWA